MNKNNYPNLFLIGAMKSGTSSIHELLAAHPEIYMSNPKEPCYFVEPSLLHDMWPEMWEMGFWKSEEAYLQLFKDVAGEKIIGESSTDYSKRPEISGVPQKINKFNPNAKFLYIMRDPVQRTISHYWHMTEHRGEMRPPEKAIFEDPIYIDVSHYVHQLEPYIELFGKENIYALTFEEYRNNSAGEIQNIYKWLGVDSAFIPKNLHSQHNVTPEIVRKKTGRHGLDKFRHSKMWDIISVFAPKFIKRFGVILVEEPVHRDAVDMSQVIDKLRPIQQQQTAELGKLLNRNFEEWTTLYGTS